MLGRRHATSGREIAMSTGDALQETLVALRQQAAVLTVLRLRWSQLRDARVRSSADLGALLAAIDAGLDERLLIAEGAGAVDPAGSWRVAATELERQVRRLGVLRAQVLSLYGPAGGGLR
jgi:hypothetical protein